MDKKYGILIICAVTLLLCFVGGASAKTWYVDDSGGADFMGIQEAVIAAGAGDTIIVRDGFYIENIIVNKRLTIRSENGADSIRVLAGDEDDPIFYVTADYVKIKWVHTGICKFWNTSKTCNLLQYIQQHLLKQPVGHLPLAFKPQQHIE